MRASSDMMATCLLTSVLALRNSGYSSTNRCMSWMLSIFLAARLRAV